MSQVALGLLVVSGVVSAVLRWRRGSPESAQDRLLPPLALDEQERVRALAAERPRTAVRLVRRQLEVGRAEARTVLARLLAGTTYPATWEQVADGVDPRVRAEVARLVHGDQRVRVVRTLRESANVGLVSGVRVVDAIAASEPLDA